MINNQKKNYDELSNINKYSEQLKIMFFLNKYNTFYIKIKNLFKKKSNNSNFFIDFYSVIHNFEKNRYGRKK